MSESLKQEIFDRLNLKTIHELRQLGRAIGVPHPADGKKENLMDGIMAVATGEKDPETPSKRGAPPKSQEYDRQLASDIFRCREICLSAQINDDKKADRKIFVANGDRNSLDYVDSGILECCGDKWFLRTTGCRENLSSDVFVNEYFVKTYNLREGDFVTGKCKRRSRDEMSGLSCVIRVNGDQPENLSSRCVFDSFKPIYADRKLSAGNSATGRIVDLFAPIGAGQRVFISSQKAACNTQILKDVVKGIRQANRNVKIVIVSVDVSPEDAEDFSSLFKDEDVFTSTFDAGTVAHLRTVRLALEYCKRQTEKMQDVVLVIDNLTRLIRAYNAYARQFTAGLDYSAVDSIKRLLATARNTDKGASLTIITALVCGNGDAFEESAYSALNDIFNVKIPLSASLLRNGVYPPIVIGDTYSSSDTRLLKDNEMSLALKLRKSDNQKIIELFNSTTDNSQIK